MRRLLALFTTVVLFGCPGVLVEDGDGGTGGGDGTGGGNATGGGGPLGGGLGTGGGSTGGGGAVMVFDGGLPGMPCDVSTVVGTYCISCHGTPPTQSAPVSLDSAAQFRLPSAVDSSKTYGQRSVTRMKDAVAPMPPGVHLPQAAIDAVDAWVTAGMPDSVCDPSMNTFDAGTVDAGPPEPTCLSNAYQPQPTPANDHGSRTMAPGWACISCHTGQNFQGQNPGGLRASGDVHQFMGTVFRSANEKDLCQPQLGVAATVEIYNMSGSKVLTMTVNSGGNFYGDVSGGMPRPYTAKVVTAAGSRTMTTAQTSGDCNTCHTVLGEQGAPGRIAIP